MQNISPSPQPNTSIDLPRLGATVRTPAGLGTFQGAAYVLKRGSDTEIESMTAEVTIAGRRCFIDMEEVEVL